MIDKIRINPSSEVPLFRQLVLQIKALIADGTLQPEQALPSVRSLAKELGINPMTISKAISQLTDDGWLTYQRGQPSRVAANITAANDIQQQWLEPALRELIQRAKQLQISHEDVQNQLSQLWQDEP